MEFYSINKFDKLVHLVGFVIKIYHVSRSPESQTVKQELPLGCWSYLAGVNRN
jgi:hypothetical protein